MSNATTQNTLDIRLKDCKHDRLRQAMQFHSRHISRPVVVEAPVVKPVAARKPASRSQQLAGAVVMVALAFGWFLTASYSSTDFSQFETDTYAGPISCIITPAC